MKHLVKFSAFNESMASKIIGTAALAMGAVAGSNTGLAKDAPKQEQSIKPYEVSDRKLNIIEDLQNILGAHKIDYKIKFWAETKNGYPIPEFHNKEEVNDYIDYLNDLCDSNNISKKEKKTYHNMYEPKDKKYSYSYDKTLP